MPLISTILVIVSSLVFVHSSVTQFFNPPPIDAPRDVSEVLSESTTNCTAPSPGCGAMHYWDSGACMCKSYDVIPTVTLQSPGTGGCTLPSGGCEQYHYWDQSICSCRPYPTATPVLYTAPTSTPVPTATRIPTPSIYPTNPVIPTATTIPIPTYSTSQTTGTCTYPSGGCGNVYYWDPVMCKCKAPHTPTPTYSTNQTPTTVPTYMYPTSTPSVVSTQPTTDRFAYESSSQISCVKLMLTPEEFEKFRYLVPVTAADQDFIRNLSERVRSCWAVAITPTGTSGSQAVRADIARSPVDKEACLIGAIGKQAFQEIASDIRPATHEEHIKFESCYGRVATKSVTYATKDEKLSDTTEVCLKNALQNNYEAVKSGKIQVPYQMQPAVDACFGIEKKPFQEAKKYSVPETIKQCLRDGVGEGRFQQITEGEVPTSLEKQKAESCFQQLNKAQSVFIPIPAEQVPFVEERPDVVQVAAVEQVTTPTEEKGTEVKPGAVKFSGKAPPGSTVTIYVYSEPIVVTTQADENGDWVYTLEQPLEGEEHVAYTTVRSGDGAIVRSSVFNFTVVEASERAPDQFVKTETLTENTEQSFITRSIVLIMAVSAAVITIVIFIYLFSQPGAQKRTS